MVAYSESQGTKKDIYLQGCFYSMSCCFAVRIFKNILLIFSLCAVITIFKVFIFDYALAPKVFQRHINRTSLYTRHKPTASSKFDLGCLNNTPGKS